MQYLSEPEVISGSTFGQSESIADLAVTTASNTPIATTSNNKSGEKSGESNESKQPIQAQLVLPDLSPSSYPLPPEDDTPSSSEQSSIRNITTTKPRVKDTLVKETPPTRNTGTNSYGSRPRRGRKSRNSGRKSRGRQGSRSEQGSRSRRNARSGRGTTDSSPAVETGRFRSITLSNQENLSDLLIRGFDDDDDDDNNNNNVSLPIRRTAEDISHYESGYF